MFDFINSIPNRLFAVAGLLALILIALIGVEYYQQSQAVEGLADSELLLAPKDKIINYDLRQIRNTDDPQKIEEVVVYDYVTEKIVPPTTYQGLNENMDKRTPSAQFYLKSTRQVSEDKQESEYIGKFYTKPNWTKEKGEWRQIDTATTTRVAFERQTKLTLLDKAKRLFGEPAFAILESYYSGAGDGYVTMTAPNVSDTWASVHDATSGNSVDATSPTFNVSSGRTFFINPDKYTIRRGFLPIDTSNLPDDALISSSSLYLYISTAALFGTAANDFITLVQTSQASNTTLGTADFDQCGAISNPTEGIDTANRATTTQLITETYFSFLLNATGRSWISLADYTKLGVRIGHDVLNVANESLSGPSFYAADETGTAKDPYLAIEYTIIEPAKIIINDGGKIIINDGGKVKID